jgi:hypothetical protein
VLTAAGKAPDPLIQKELTLLPLGARASFTLVV